MTTTNRLKIPLIEKESIMSPELWNNGFNQIDNVCVGFSNLGISTVTFNNKREAIITIPGNGTNFVFIDLFPANPQEQDNWKAIARASIRCFQDTTDPTKIHLISEGTIPDKSVSINVVGWY